MKNKIKKFQKTFAVAKNASGESFVTLPQRGDLLPRVRVTGYSKNSRFMHGSDYDSLVIKAMRKIKGKL